MVRVLSGLILILVVALAGFGGWIYTTRNTGGGSASKEAVANVTADVPTADAKDLASEGTVRAMVEKDWSNLQQNRLRYRLGAITIHRDNGALLSNMWDADLPERIVPIYTAMEMLGLVHVTHTPYKPTGLSDLVGVARNVVETLQVSATTELPAGVTSNGTFLEVPLGKIRVTRLVSNETVRRGTDDYRVILVTADRTLDPTLQKLDKALGHETEVVSKLRGRIAYQRDPFTGEWALRALDESVDEPNAAFPTNSVPDLLK